MFISFVGTSQKWCVKARGPKSSARLSNLGITARKIPTDPEGAKKINRLILAEFENYISPTSLANY
jgi:hypothetical protein